MSGVEVRRKPARIQYAGNHAQETFEEWRVRVTRVGQCPVCGKRVRRSMTVERTVNPWNKGADGVPLTSEQVRDQAVAAAHAWEPTPRQMACKAHPDDEVCSTVGHQPRALTPDRCLPCGAMIDPTETKAGA